MSSRLKTELTDTRMLELAEADKAGRIVILPSRNDEIIHAIEIALRIKLYDWQIAYIFGASDYTMRGRVTGKTTAYMLKLLLSEGDPIHLYKQRVMEATCDEFHGAVYHNWFIKTLEIMYRELFNPGLKLKLRKIYFSKNEATAKDWGRRL